MRYTVPETLHIAINGPCPEDLINRLTLQGISFRGYRKENEFSASLLIRGKDYTALEKAAPAAQCEVRILSRTGPGAVFRTLRTRMIFIAVMLLLTVFAYMLQNRIWFLEVSGNTTIHEDAILRMLEEQEVRFGTGFEGIDMELLRNEILGNIPQLDYITINTSGGFAEVVVRERSAAPMAFSKPGPNNLISAHDGIIEAVTVTEGTALVSAGDIVSEGQILISGITDLERVTVVTGAEGEVFGRTFHRCDAIREGHQVNKCYTGRKKRCISLSFGKNTINFFKTSGISYDNYDKMTVDKILTLPGGYALPVSITISILREYIPEEEPLDRAVSQKLLLQSLRRNTTESMSAGEILREELTLFQNERCYELQGVLECREEIGRSVEIKD